MAMKKVKVLVVDDSALARQTLINILQTDAMIEVIGSASDPFIAVKKIQSQEPDVITLDIEMPRMDGLTFLKKIMSQHPIPVVVISSLTKEGSVSAMRALDYGAAEVITKPALNTKIFFEESSIRICDAVKAAAMSKIRRRKVTELSEVTPKFSADVILAKASSNSSLHSTDIVVAVGASTGGTEALRIFLSELPLNSPGVVVVQHMPELFTRSFANRLNDMCQITVKEAENGDAVIRGRALIAPGNKHILLKRSGPKYIVELNDGPMVNRHRPSVDVLFRSVARYAGSNAIGVIMTGMGDDGAKGLLEMKQAGAKTIAQDEKTCVVFGMPKEAISLGAADKIVSLELIAQATMALSLKREN